ncbi:MAG: germination protein YpeB [Oscillospiraceae bacterium]|nr:germination protein YpeB [Oscillospiraceae bacterium]
MLRKKLLVKIISYTAAAFAVVMGYAIQSNYLMKQYRTKVEYTYSSSLEDLSAGLNNIDVALKKGIYSGTATQLSSLSAQLWKESGTAKSALAQLPASEEELTTINRFLSQVGDYSLYLSKKVISGEDITDEQRDNLTKLSQAANTISTGVSDVRMKYEEQGAWTSEMSTQLSEATITEGFGYSLTEIEDTLTDYPTLVYDGPFSDNILTGESKMLADAQDVSKEDARNIASTALDITPDTLQDDTDEDGKMPSFGFKVDNTVISVTKKGGYVVYFRKDRTVGEYQLTYDQAVEKAQIYLTEHGYENLEQSYYFTDEGMCAINFAYKYGVTTCYTDLIKVGVALDTGEVLMFEARGYLMNHEARTIATPKYTADEAQEVLSKQLTVIGSDLAIIPTAGEEERHCWEFHCTGQAGEEILVYVNTVTLQEEDILILLKTDGGTLTK